MDSRREEMGGEKMEGCRDVLVKGREEVEEKEKVEEREQ